MAKREDSRAQVTVDNKVVSPPSYIENLQELIAWVQTEVLPNVRIITDIIVDGKYLSFDEENEAHKLNLVDFGLVELRSRRAIEVAVDALTAALDSLPELYLELEETADAFYNGDIHTGLRLFSSAMNTMEWYLNLIFALETTIFEPQPWLKVKGKESVSSGCAGQPPNQKEELFLTFSQPEELRKKVYAMDKAHREQNFDKLTQIIRNQILPIVAGWNEELPEIIEKLKAEQHEA